MTNSNLKHRGTLFLIGGGDEDYHTWSDHVYQKLVDLTAGGRFAILTYKDDENWMSSYLQWLGASAATTFVFENREDANHRPTCLKLMDYDAIFMEGGHQQIYLNYWKGTLLEQQIADFYYSGKVLAGTSAGAMLQGEIAFISKNGRVHPDVLFQNPYLQSIFLEDEFFKFVPDTIIDTHFSERGRIVRLLPLMARIYAQKNKHVLGIGIDEETALIVKPDLVAEVVGFRTTTFLVPTAKSKIRFQFPKPPVYTDLVFHRLGAGAKFDLKHNRLKDTEVAPVTNSRNISRFKNNLIFLGAKSCNAGQDEQKSIHSFFHPVSQKDSQLSFIASQQSRELAYEFEKSLRSNGCFRIAMLPITQNKQESLIQAPVVKQSDGIVIAGNQLDEMISFLRSGTPVAKAFRSRLKTGVLLAFLSDAIKLAGRWALLPDANPARIERIDGLNLIKNSVIMPDFLENRERLYPTLEAVYRTLFQKSMNLGILMESRNQATLTPARTITFYGSTGTYLIDAHDARLIPSQNLNKNQMVTWTNARLHLIHAEYEFDLLNCEVKSGRVTSEIRQIGKN